MNVPGVEGPPGTPCVPCADGVDGKNSYTVTTLDYTIPDVGSNVTVTVSDSSWMIVGQIVISTGPATFKVISKPTTTTAVLQFLGYLGDEAVGTVVTAGAGIGPSGVSGFFANQTVYGSGTAYAVTATPELIALGTTTPSLTFSETGTYLLFSRVRWDYAAATFAAVRTVTTKLRRTNNTATDLTNGSAGWKTQIITTLTFTAIDQAMPPVVYNATAGDIVELWASIDVVPSAGALNAVEAEIVALRIA